MKKRLILFGLIISLFLITTISAGITFSQPNSYYNLGDIIEVQAKVDPILEGFLKIDLACGSSINVFNGLLDETGSITLKFPLTYSYIKETTGNCYFLGEYAGQSQQSSGFEISDKLDIKLNVESFVSNPGEGIIISGSATKLNGAGANGEVKITIPLLRTENETQNNIFKTNVIDGIFSININSSKTAPAGNYKIEIDIYETDKSGRKNSESIATANLKINQILKKIDIAIALQQINPGETLSFKPILMDQSGGPMGGDVSVIITTPSLIRIFEKISKSEQTIDYQIPTDLGAGYYEIEASSLEIKNIKKFYVNEKATAIFEIVDGTLIVKNIGNIPYQKDIQVDLNGEIFVKSVGLELGEAQEFKLTGDGQYDVIVSDGESEINQQRIVLIGSAVGVKELKSGLVALNTPIVWIFLIIIIGAVCLFFFRDILKKKSFAYHLDRFKIFNRAPKESFASGIKKKEIDETDFNKNKLRIAEQVLVVDGKKNTASVLVLKLKNKLTNQSKEALKKIIQGIASQKGAVYEKDNNVIAIFSPVFTRSYKNEVSAVKSAEIIKGEIMEYNKRFTDKIEFGIAVGSGEIINKIEEGKLKFTALGNLMPSVKRIAETSHKQILLTKEAFGRAGNEVKAVKKGDVYEAQRVLDSEQNQKFIEGFLKRNNRGKDLLK